MQSPIQLGLLVGPKLAWRFESLNDSACKVILVLEFEFAGKLISAAFGKVFEQIANTMVESFVARAKEVYTD